MQWIVVGHHDNKIVYLEAIGPFKTKKLANAWVKEQHMYKEHTIMPIESPDSLLYKLNT